MTGSFRNEGRIFILSNCGSTSIFLLRFIQCLGCLFHRKLKQIILKSKLVATLVENFNIKGPGLIKIGHKKSVADQY